jgi:predicted nucleotidyltransferase
MRSHLDRQVLIAKLERIIETVENAKDLPLDVKEILVFGSFIRGKELPGDLDIIMVHEDLTPEQLELTVKAIEGHGTSLERQMNGRLKSNSETVDIIYGPNLEVAMSRMRVKSTIVESVWSKDDHNWKQKLAKVQSRSPEETLRILERDLERLREYTRSLENNMAAYERAVKARLIGPDLTQFQKERIAAMEEVKKRKNIELFVLLP